MQLIGLILLLASSWYIWNLTSKFLDEKTKKEIANDFKTLNNQLDETKNRFSKSNLSRIWTKYKEENSSNSNQDKK